jgi:hypothetical protein
MLHLILTSETDGLSGLFFLFDKETGETIEKSADMGYDRQYIIFRAGDSI